MQGRATRIGFHRVLFAALAFYAYFLQTLLVSAMPCPDLDPLPGVICSQHQSTGQPDQQSPLQHDHQCCTALHAVKDVPLPAVAFETVPVRRATDKVAYELTHLAPKTGPPTCSHSPRSPPAA